MRIRRVLEAPFKIFIFCLIFVVASMLFNGGWLNLYSLRRDRVDLQSQMVQLKGSLRDLDVQLQRVKDPSFIERQAMDQLDMASDHDLVFVFSE